MYHYLHYARDTRPIIYVYVGRNEERGLKKKGSEWWLMQPCCRKWYVLRSTYVIWIRYKYWRLTTSLLCTYHLPPLALAQKYGSIALRCRLVVVPGTLIISFRKGLLYDCAGNSGWISNCGGKRRNVIGREGVGRLSLIGYPSCIDDVCQQYIAIEKLTVLSTGLSLRPLVLPT